MPGQARIDRQCVTCGVTFAALCRETRRGPMHGRFCSRPCASVYACTRRNELHPQAGAGNNHWKGGVSTDHMRYVRRFVRKSPAKKRVQVLTAAAIKRGRLVRPETCSQCGIAGKAHAHHDNYRKPYDVRWLCQPCHNRHHAAIKRGARTAAAASATQTMSGSMGPGAKTARCDSDHATAPTAGTDARSGVAGSAAVAPSVAVAGSAGSEE